MDIMLIINIVYGILIAYIIIQFVNGLSEIFYNFFAKILIKRKLKKHMSEMNGVELNDK